MTTQEYKKSWYIKNRKKLLAKAKLRYKKNRKALLEKAATYRTKNKEQIAKYLAIYAKNNRLKLREYKKAYYQKNKKSINKKQLHRLKVNQSAKLASYLRRRLNKALRNNCKKGSAVELLGISISSFKAYLSGKFRKGMTWNNYGKVWHVDHIKPLNLFDLSDARGLSRACHYTNLQPLFALENYSKGARYA